MADGAGSQTVLFLVLAIFIGNIFRTGLNLLPFDVPYTAVIFLCGVGWGSLLDAGALTSASDTVSGIGPGLMLLAFLPILVFFSSFETKWYMLRRSITQILLLAIVGVAITTCLTAVVYKETLEVGHSWPEAFLIGAILSATDPVAVVALMRTNSAPVQVITLLEGESLLNDGFAMVAFRLFYKMVDGNSESPGKIVGDLFQLSFGAMLLGTTWAIAVVYLLGRVQGDAIVESTMVLSMAYLLFYVAESEAHVSGVLSVVVFGLSFAWYGKSRFSPGMIAHTRHFLETISYMSETILFVLCGAIVADAVKDDAIESADWGRAVALWVYIMIVRAVMLGLLSQFLVRSGNGFGWKRAAVMTWGGLRGAVSLALALDVKVAFADDPQRGEFANKSAFYTSVVVILTLVINAPLTAPLLKWLQRQHGYALTPAEIDSNNRAITSLLESSNSHLDALKHRSTYNGTNWSAVKEYISKKISVYTQNTSAAASIAPSATEQLEEKQARLLFLKAVQDNMAIQQNEGSLRWSSAETLSYLFDLVADSIARAKSGTVTFSDSSWLDGSHKHVSDKTLRRLSAASPERGMSGAQHVELVAQISHPSWVHWVKKVCKNAPWPINLAIEQLIESQLLNTISAMDGLIRSFEAASREVSPHVSDSVRPQLLHEADLCIQAATARLRKIELKYPQEFQHVRSVASAQRVISFQIAKVSENSGSYSIDLLTSLQRELLRQQNRLILNRVSFRDDAGHIQMRPISFVESGSPRPDSMTDGYLDISAYDDSSDAADKTKLPPTSPISSEKIRRLSVI